MTINFNLDRVAKAAIAAGIALGGFALAGAPASADVDTQIGQPQPAAPSPETPSGPGIAFAPQEKQEHEQYLAELIRRAQGSDRHLENLADEANERASERRDPPDLDCDHRSRFDFTPCAV